MAAVEKRGVGHAPLMRAVKPSSPSARQQRRSKSDLDDRDAKGAPRYSHKASSQTKLLQGRKSNPQQKCEIKKEIHQPRSETQSSLKKEIQQLEIHLKDQQVVRGALEKALGPDDDDPAADAAPPTTTLQNESPALKPATQLIREVATLELEIKHLEQYLLTLYRKAFEQQQVSSEARREREASAAARKLSVSSSRPGETPRAKASVVRGGGGGDPTTLHYGSCPPLSGKGRRHNGVGTTDDCSPSTCPRRTTTADLADSAAAGLRSQSALSFRGAWSSSSSRISPTEDSLARALRSCHSQPFSFLEHEGETAPASGVVSLADYLGTSVADHIPETPNNLSEEIVRCMAGVYCRLADPPLPAHHRPSSSPSSSLSSAAVSPHHLVSDADMWSPSSYCGGRKDGAGAGAQLDSRLINPFRVEGLKEFSGPYSAMVEVPAISRDRTRLREAEDLLQIYKLILYRLETVDLRRMTSEEKLAFWINVHNALVMHAYLKYGVPQNQVKKTSLLVKAECKIAGRAINAAVIQGLVLGCTTHCSTSGHWLRTLLQYPRTKTSRASKAGSEEWRAFAVRQPEPLLRFALCSGSHSDPAVRVFFPKRLAQQLEAAREEYVRATAGVWKDHRVLLPKLLDAYARDAGLSPDRLLDAVQRCFPETLRTAVQRCRRGDGGGGSVVRPASKVVEWVAHRQSFRYLLARDLAFPHLS